MNSTTTARIRNEDRSPQMSPRGYPEDQLFGRLPSACCKRRGGTQLPRSRKCSAPTPCSDAKYREKSCCRRGSLDFREAESAASAVCDCGGAPSTRSEMKLRALFSGLSPVGSRNRKVPFLHAWAMMAWITSSLLTLRSTATEAPYRFRSKTSLGILTMKAQINCVHCISLPEI
jgi:hypothetical protein